jgi:hypothetical protein
VCVPQQVCVTKCRKVPVTACEACPAPCCEQKCCPPCCEQKCCEQKCCEQKCCQPKCCWTECKTTCREAGFLSRLFNRRMCCDPCSTCGDGGCGK